MIIRQPADLAVIATGEFLTPKEEPTGQSTWRTVHYLGRAVRPEGLVGLSINKFGCDANPVPVPANGAFKHVSHV
jgi:hypothetical protein